MRIRGERGWVDCSTKDGGQVWEMKEESRLFAIVLTVSVPFLFVSMA